MASSDDQLFQRATEAVRVYLHDGLKRPLDLFNLARLADPIPEDEVTVVGFRRLLQQVQFLAPEQPAANALSSTQTIQLFRDFGAAGVVRGGGLSFHAFRASIRKNSRPRSRVQTSSEFSQHELRRRTASRASRRRLRRLQSSMDNAFPMNALGQTPHLVPQSAPSRSPSSEKLLKRGKVGMNMDMSMEFGWSVVSSATHAGDGNYLSTYAGPAGSGVLLMPGGGGGGGTR